MTIDRDQKYRDMAVRGKYRRLYTHLCSLPARAWRTTFGEIESILGFELPASARLHRPWWSNQRGGNGHSQALAWSVAGWETASVDMDSETLLLRPRTSAGYFLSQSRRGVAGPQRRFVAGRIESQASGHLRRQGLTPMFIDTNVLVNSRILEAPDHHVARSRLERAFRESDPLTISRQVVREYLSVVTRPQIWAVAMAREDALDDANRLISSFEILEDGPLVTESLIALCREVPVGGRQIHDANIVATMLAHGERRLLTLTTSDFRRFGGRIELVDS